MSLDMNQRAYYHWKLHRRREAIALVSVFGTETTVRCRPNRFDHPHAIRFNFIGDREGFTYDNPGKSMMANIITNGAK